MIRKKEVTHWLNIKYYSNKWTMSIIICICFTSLCVCVCVAEVSIDKWYSEIYGNKGATRTNKENMHIYI